MSLDSSLVSLGNVLADNGARMPVHRGLRHTPHARLRTRRRGWLRGVRLRVRDGHGRLWIIRLMLVQVRGIGEDEDRLGHLGLALGAVVEVEDEARVARVDDVE